MSVASFTPVITSAAFGYNVGIAETYSWIPITGAGRPLFAKAVFSVNTINYNGFIITSDTIPVYGNFSQVKVAYKQNTTDVVFDSLTSNGSVFTSITFGEGFVLEGPIQGYQLHNAGKIVVVASKM